MKPPQFWQRDGLLPRLLWPVSAVVGTYTASRAGQAGWRAPVPVVCCGNVTVGGAGKTTVALDILARLARHGRRPHALTRGYGGTVRGPHRVRPSDTPAVVGDEALLLARNAPTWVGADRGQSARAAIAAGADALVMDDGLQNHTLAKSLALLVIDADGGLGNERVLPAGPLRERLESAVARCHAAVLIGEDRHDIMSRVRSLPVHRARLSSVLPSPQLNGTMVFAMAGIGRPGKFHATLRAAGLTLAGNADFPDHHTYSDEEITDVLRRAEAARAVPVTTPKDAVRLPAALRAAFTVIDVALDWDDEPQWDRLLGDACRYFAESPDRDPSAEQVRHRGAPSQPSES